MLDIIFAHKQFLKQEFILRGEKVSLEIVLEARQKRGVFGWAGRAFERVEGNKKNVSFMIK